MDTRTPTLQRKLLSGFYDVIFRVVDYDRFFYRLGRSKIVQSNLRFQNRVASEAKTCAQKYGIKQVAHPIELSNGLKVANCDLRDFVQLSLYYTGGYSVAEQELVAKYLKPGDIFVDVGANIGVFALAAARIVGPAGRVIAVEPASDTIAQLKDNAEINDLEEQIQFLLYALADEDGELTLYDSDQFEDDTGQRSFFQTGKIVETVPTRIFDGLVDEGEVVIDRPLGVIKIDVEGAEPLVLKGMERTIKTHRPRLIMFEVNYELLDNSGVTSSELKQLMQSYGYRLEKAESVLRYLQNEAWVPV